MRFFFAHVAPQLIRFDVANLTGIHLGQCLARNLLFNPVHHRVVADTHQSFSRSQPHAFGVVLQSTLFEFIGHKPSIQIAKGGVATLAPVALMSVATASVFD